MATERINDLRAFKDFIEAKLSNGGSTLSPDEVMTEWELENQSEEEQAETLKAIQRGLDDMHAGRTVDAFEFAERMRLKINSIATRS